MVEQVHPEFDPATQTWFTPCGREASTLAALSEMLPGVHIVDYYPGGYDGSVVLREPRRVSTRRPHINFRGLIEARPMPAAPRAAPAKRDMRGKVPRMAWTEKMDSQLRELTRLGWSAGSIAKELDITRSAVIGRCHRLGLKLSGGKIGRPRGGRAL